MATPAAIDRLGAIAAHLREADHPLAGWLTEVVASVRLGMLLEAAFGLEHGYDANCRQQAQDAALRSLVAAIPNCTSAKARSDRIAGLIAAYETTAWPRDKAAMRRPSGTNGHLFDYLAAGGPTSAERIRKLLPGLVTGSNEMTSLTGT